MTTKIMWMTCLLICTGARAQGLSYTLPSNLKDHQLAKVRQVVAEVLRLLPPSAKRKMDFAIEVHFKKLDSTPIGQVRCPGTTLGQTNGRSIEVHQNLLEGLMGRPLDFSVGCHYQDAKTAFIANLIHETTHILDQKYLPEGYSSMGKGWLSKDPQFLYLQGYRIQGRKIFKANTLPLASPLPYEFGSPEEAAATHMELWLLDPQYACRRPALAHYFQTKFKHVETESCSPTWPVFLDGMRLGNLDQNRLFEIHVLMAEPGENLVSSWGHIMFRLVFCSPERQRPGPECLKDLSHHYVVSPRGNVESLQTSALNGLFGGYESQLHLIPFHRVLKIYTQDELRSVRSYKLYLNDSDKLSLFYTLLERSWLYRSRFSLIANNCAGEVLNSLIASSQVFQHLTDQALSLLTPVRTLGLIERSQRVNSDHSVPSNKSIQSGLYFPSQKTEVEQAAKQLGIESIDSSIFAKKSDLTPEGLRELSHGKLQKTASGLTIANFFINRLAWNLEMKMTKLVNESTGGELAELKYQLNQAIANRLATLRSFSSQSYGLPSTEAAQDLADSLLENQLAKSQQAAIKAWLDQHFARELQEISEWRILARELAQELISQRY